MLSMNEIKTCRLCNSENFDVFLKLGTMPLAGNFLKKTDIGSENLYPIEILEKILIIIISVSIFGLLIFVFVKIVFQFKS